MSYDAEVLVDSPIAYYKLDETSGTTATDASGNSRNGTYSGSGVTYSASGPTGMTGVTLDGVNGEITTHSGLPALLGDTQPQTIEMWVKSTATIDQSASALYLVGSAQDSKYIIATGALTGSLTNEVVALADDPGGTRRTGWTGFSAPVGWHHHVLAFNGTQNGWTYYLDGRAIGTLISSGSGAKGIPTSNPTMVLGRVNASALRSAISLSNVAIYDIELPADRVRAHYAAASPLAAAVLADAPVGYWPLDETADATAYDQSGNARDATHDVGSGSVLGGGTFEDGTKAGVFNGDDTIRTASSVSTFAPATATLELWVKYTDSGTTLRTPFMVRDNSVTNGGTLGAILLNNGAAGRVSALWVNGGNNVTGALTFDGGVHDGVWHQIVFVLRSGSGTKELWVDGVQVDTDATAKDASPTDCRIRIGSNDGIQFFDGSLAHAAVYDYALTWDRIITHYEAVFPAPPPANDNFDSPEDLGSAHSGSTSGNNQHATTETDEAIPTNGPGDGPHYSIWYKWTAPESVGRGWFSTEGSGLDQNSDPLDTVIGVYTGNAVDSLVEIASNDDNPDTNDYSSKVTFTPISATVYRIQVSSYGDYYGDIALSWQFNPSGAGQIQWVGFIPIA